MRARERNETKRIAKRHRSAPRIVNADSIPVRDTDDAYGNPFAGLPGNRLAVNAIGSGELGPNSVLNSHIGEQINATHLPNIAGLNGDLPSTRLTGNIPDGLIPNIGKGKLPGDVVYGNGGKVDRGQIHDFLNGDRLIKPGTLSIETLAGRPWASKTDPAQVRRIARRIARDIVKDMVKLTSLKGH